VKSSARAPSPSTTRTSVKHIAKAIVKYIHHNDVAHKRFYRNGPELWKHFHGTLLPQQNVIPVYTPARRELIPGSSPAQPETVARTLDRESRSITPAVADAPRTVGTMSTPRFGSVEPNTSTRTSSHRESEGPRSTV
jgi:hypothetical protein